MAINISSYPTNVTDITDFFIWANSPGVLGDSGTGMIGLGFLVVFFIISVTTMKRFETKKPFAAAAFGTAIVAGLLWAIELLPFKYVGLSIIIAGFGLLWILFDRD